MKSNLIFGDSITRSYGHIVRYLRQHYAMSYPASHLSLSVDYVVSADFFKNTPMKFIVCPGNYIIDTEFFQPYRYQNTAFDRRTYGNDGNIEVSDTQFIENRFIHGVCLNGVCQKRSDILDLFLIFVNSQYIMSLRCQCCSQTHSESAESEYCNLFFHITSCCQPILIISSG